MATHRSDPPKRGTTLIEVAVSTVLVGLLLVASLETVGGALRTARASGQGLDGLMLVELLLQEIAALPYEDPDGPSVALGTEADEGSYSNRDEVDDLDDLNGWYGSPPEEQDGTPIPGFTGWSRNVVVEYLEVLAAADSTLNTSITDEGVKRVVVTAVDPDGKATSLTLIRTRDGALESPPALDTVWTTNVNAQIATGGGAAVHSAGATTNESGGP